MSVVVVVVFVVGNGLNSPHNGERASPAERQSTMPPSVPIRKDKKDVPVSMQEWLKDPQRS